METKNEMQKGKELRLLELMQEAGVEISESTIYCAAEFLNLKAVDYLANKRYCCSIKDFCCLTVLFSKYEEQKEQEKALKILQILSFHSKQI